MFVCVSVCLSVREHISGTTGPIFIKFVLVTHGRCSVLLWRHCDTLCTWDFMVDVIFAHNGSLGSMSIPFQRVTSLRRRARADVPPGCVRWFYRVLGDGWRRH